MTDKERAAFSYRNDQQCIVDQAKRIHELESQILSMGLDPSVLQLHERITALEDKIASLTEENNKLKGSPFHPVIPPDIRKKFKNSNTCWDNTRFEAISKAIRRICFPLYEKRPVKGRLPKVNSGSSPCGYTLPVNEMTNSQYTRYVEILGKVADVLVEYEYTGETTL